MAEKNKAEERKISIPQQGPLFLNEFFVYS
ncbi:hypothetical protein SapgrDRAFT_1898 [Saprospira grandis DSM 2844]|uniref:Uncharacterized protein n=1 Tax=Saprospira grandis DSM 2844 TaxID=694433 RepID=J1I4B7_9BACT|nr:hypothetical protein SapgrDRAFT_1898 [Saprospira grandis DSM 2844]